MKKNKQTNKEIKYNKYLESLIEIKLLIGSYYENLGRLSEEFSDDSEAKDELISSIDDLIEKAEIPNKFFILKRLNNFINSGIHLNTDKNGRKN